LPSAYRVHYDESVPCVQMVWQGYFTSDAFRAASADVLDVLRRTKCPNLLGDVTDFTLIGAADQAWLNDEWIPQAIEAGVRDCALVQPTYFFNRVAVETIAQRVSDPRMVVHYFGDREAARAFLRGLRRE
jgi:hypothetical protein